MKYNIYYIFMSCICFATAYAYFESDESEPRLQLPDYVNNRFPRIVGGKPVAPNTYPHQASLHYRGRHRCGAVIIDEQHVLTAAHCVENPNTIPLNHRLISIVAGVVDLRFRDNPSRQDRNVSNIYIHEDYIPRTFENDIAVLRVQHPFILGNDSEASAAAAILQTDSVPEETLCSVSGWGGLNQTMTFASQHLQKVKIYIINSQVCSNVFSNFIEDIMICAGYQHGGRDACQGDSGGGLMCNSLLTGIVSFGYGCGRPGFPGVYTKVRTYLQWIDITVKRTDTGNLPSDGPLGSSFDRNRKRKSSQEPSFSMNTINTSSPFNFTNSTGNGTGSGNRPGGPGSAMRSEQNFVLIFLLTIVIMLCTYANDF